MQDQDKLRNIYLNMSDEGLQKRLEEIRATINENDVSSMDESCFSMEELKKLKVEAHLIQGILMDWGISFTPIRVAPPEILKLMFSLVTMRSMGEGWDLPGKTRSSHSGR